MNSTIKNLRAIWFTQEFRKRRLTSPDACRAFSRHEIEKWPCAFDVKRRKATKLELDDELEAWDAASDEDFSSFEERLRG